MASFATPAELAVHLGVPPYTGASLTRAQALIDRASAIIRLYTGQDLELTTGRMEEWAGDPKRFAIFLSQRPVRPVTEVAVNAAVLDADDYTWTRWGTLTRADGKAWETGPILITYDSGYDPTSDELEAVKGITLEAAGRALTSSPPEANTFGLEVPEAVGWVPHVFLTLQERADLMSLGQVPVG